MWPQPNIKGLEAPWRVAGVGLGQWPKSLDTNRVMCKDDSGEGHTCSRRPVFKNGCPSFFPCLLHPGYRPIVWCHPHLECSPQIAGLHVSHPQTAPELCFTNPLGGSYSRQLTQQVSVTGGLGSMGVTRGTCKQPQSVLQQCIWVNRENTPTGRTETEWEGCKSLRSPESKHRRNEGQEQGGGGGDTGSNLVDLTQLSRQSFRGQQDWEAGREVGREAGNQKKSGCGWSVGRVCDQEHLFAGASGPSGCRSSGLPFSSQLHPTAIVCVLVRSRGAGGTDSCPEWLRDNIAFL